MEYSHRYRAYTTEEVAERLEHHLDVHRQLYNRVCWDYENSPADDKPSEYDQNNKLPEWKQKWSIFGELYSKAAQATVARFHHSLTVLSELKEKGYTVGRLKRQAPSEYRSVAYNQSGFDLDEKRGPRQARIPPLQQNWVGENPILASDSRPRHYQRGHVQERNDW